MMNIDANPVAVYEPNAVAGQVDLGGDFNLAGAAEKRCKNWGMCQGAASAAFPPPWPGLGLNPRGPTFRAETQHGAAAYPTVPPLPEEGEEGSAEPEDPLTELLRRVLAGNRESDMSRVKLAKIPTLEYCRQRRHGKSGSRSDSRRGPTRSSQSWKQNSCRSVAARHSGQTTCARDLFQHRRQDVLIFGDRTPHRTQHTRVFFSLRAVWHSVSYVHFIRLDESRQYVSRVLKTVRLLHSHSSTSCLVAPPGPA